MSTVASTGPRPSGGDPKVAAVLEHWLPRFTANDLDYADVRRILDRVRTWVDWPHAWADAAAGYEALGRAALARGRTVTAAAHLRRAALTLQFAQFVLTEDEELRAALHARQTEVYALAAPLLRPPAERVAVPFRGAHLHGYVRLPRGVANPGLVLLVPGLESTKEQFGTYEPYFLDRGDATLAIEGPGQGETWAELPFRAADYTDALVAVAAFARGLEGIDSGRPPSSSGPASAATSCCVPPPRSATWRASSRSPVPTTSPGWRRCPPPCSTVSSGCSASRTPRPPARCWRRSASTARSTPSRRPC